MRSRGAKKTDKQLDVSKDSIKSPRGGPPPSPQIYARQVLCVSLLYLSQQWKVGGARGDLVALGEKGYRAGVGRKNIAARTARHSPNGGGNRVAALPAL